MYTIKQIIQYPKDCKENENLYVKDKVVYLTVGGKEYKHICDCWYMKVDSGDWINLQGGVPAYQQETVINEELFDKVEG